jgi:protein TonB
MIAGVWHWPEAARSPGERGRVTVEFRLSPRGALEEVRVAVSSGSPHLDGAAVAAVTRAAPFPPRPAAIVRDPFLVSALFLYE